jgi:hypothetical protein
MRRNGTVEKSKLARHGAAGRVISTISGGRSVASRKELLPLLHTRYL